MATNTIKRHSTFPPLSFEFLNEDGEPVDCTPFEVRLLVKNRHDVVIIDAIVGASGSHAVWINKSTGVGEYQWQNGDTDIAGRYAYEFKLTRLYDGKTFKLPEEDYYYYLVLIDILESASGVV